MNTENHLLILLYHGVTNCKSKGIENYSGKHINYDLFIDQMNFLRKHGTLLSMNDVIGHFKSKKPLPFNAVAVTFDDGFKNNYSMAAPVMQELKIPATFYLTTGIIGTNKMFWVDELEDCINRTNKSVINLYINGEESNFILNTKVQKIKSLNTIKKYCKNVDQIEKNKIILNLIYETKVTPEINASINYHKLDWPEVKEMNNNRLFTIGSHGVDHDILSCLSYDNLIYQVRESILMLRQKLEENIIHYSYPEGQINHFNDDVIKVLKNNSIECCPTAINGKNKLSDDLFHLKRTMVGFEKINFPYKYFKK